jgi:predicted amidohydrolase
MMTQFKISCVQYSYKQISTFEDFASDVIRLLDQCTDSDFVIFPEAFTLELHYIIPEYNLTRVYEYTDRYLDIFSKQAVLRKQYILAGSHIINKDKRGYNTSYFFTPQGDYHQHAKTHLYPLEAKSGITPGDSVGIIKTNKTEIGIAICYEMEFPEYVRKLTLNGAKIIFCPSYTINEAGFWRVRHCCQARAIENQIYVVHSCLVGIPKIEGMEGYGKSSILSPCEDPWPPNGVLAEARLNEDMVISAIVDVDVLLEKRENGSATTLKDRRPELY